MSEMRKKVVISSDRKKVGHLVDIIFDEELQLHSIVVGGGFLEKIKESFGFVHDIDPIINVSNIDEIDKRLIKLNLKKHELKEKFENTPISPKAPSLSNLKRKMVVDNDNTSIGRISNLVFLPCGEVAFIVACTNDSINLGLKGITSQWDLLLPLTSIEKVTDEEIVLSTHGENLEKTLNGHIIDNETAKEYLDSLKEKNEVREKVILQSYRHYSSMK